MTAIPEIPTPAHFRAQLVAWLDDHDLTPPAEEHSLDAVHAQHARVLSALYDAGWMRWGWPESAGGLGGPMILRAIVGEEVVGRGLDDPGPYSMLEVLTPTMIDYARPELAAELVPLLLSGRETWCQGFSEPGSGSDLASLTTRAEHDASSDRYLVNGQKVWTSFAQYATRCILLTRTGDRSTPNHQAITAFVVDMDSPGIEVRPLRTMHGVDEFCEVYFDDVAVPADRMLGRPGDGWQLAMDLLPFERSTCFWQRIAYLYSRFDALIAELTASLPGLPGRAFGPLTVATADSFAYTDPVDGAVSRNQGLRVLFEGGSRVVFRLSGTGTQGATLRVYLERYEPAGGTLDAHTPDMLADLIVAAEALAGIARHTARTAPDVVT